MYQIDHVAVAVEDGAVFLVDDDYEFVGTGAIESDPADLASSSNVKF